MTRRIQVGAVPVGGGAPVSIQSMCNTATEDVEATVQQIRRLEQAGCDIVRVAVPTEEAARAIPAIKRGIRIPLVADIHFDYKLALLCIDGGVDKIRINPGNIGSKERVRAVADGCRERGIPIRVGVNGGSLEKDLLRKYGGVTAEALAESALGHVRLLEDCGFGDICISVKCSRVPVNMAAYELLHERVDYPLHLGVTEAGTPEMGVLKSAIGIGGLLCRGIGDTLRVSLTADPVEEVTAAKKILQAADGAGSDRLPHLRADAVRHAAHRPGGGAAAEGLPQAHYRGGDGVRGQRPRRGRRRGCGHCRRPRRGTAVRQGQDPAEGAAGAAGGRAVPGDREAVMGDRG